MRTDNLKNIGIREATLEDFNEELAIFKFSDGQELTWEKDKLPKGLKVGNKVSFKLITDTEETEERAEIARKLLENILNETS